MRAIWRAIMTTLRRFCEAVGAFLANTHNVRVQAR